MLTDNRKEHLPSTILFGDKCFCDAKFAFYELPDKEKNRNVLLLYKLAKTMGVYKEDYNEVKETTITDDVSESSEINYEDPFIVAKRTDM